MAEPESSRSAKPAARRARLAKALAVESSSSLSSSDDDDEETRGSRTQLVTRLKSAKPRSVSAKAPEVEQQPQQQQQAPPPQQQQVATTKESSIARSIKRRFAFFRSKPENVKSSDLEAGPTTPAPPPDNRMDVVVDVHAEGEARKVSVTSKSPAGEERGRLTAEEEEELDETSDPDRVPTTSGRRRWDKPEIATEDLVEDLKKPRRRQWIEGSSSAEIRDVTGKKIVVPKRSATAEPLKHLGDDNKRSKQPVAAPRLKRLPRLEARKGFDNDGFSSDHEEVLRIETVNDSSPKIKMSSSAEIKRIEDLTSLQSEEEEDKPSEKSNASIVMIKEYKPKSEESSEELDSSSLSGSNELLNVTSKKVVPKRPSRSKRKTSSDRPLDDDEDEDDDDEEDEQETVLNVAMDKKSRRSSSSSKLDVTPLNLSKRKSSDETTISTNEEMHTSRRDSRVSRSKSKLSRRIYKSDESSKRKTSSSTRNSAEEALKQRAKKKKKKKERHKKLDELEEETKYVSVRIHRSDLLEADYVTRHPMVKVHVMNVDTGEYARHVDDGGPVMPIVTQKFDFKEKKSMVPVWEEELIFEMSYKELMTDRKVVLFEIVDLVGSTEASDQNARDACWYKVAWAFLRPIGVSGAHHVGKKVRLQLYRPKRSFRKSKNTKSEVYKWWKSNSRDKYPASLYVSVLGVDPPKVEAIEFEQLLQMNDQSENQSVRTTEEQQPQQQQQQQESVPKWTRLAAQSCQVPNETYMETEASDNGCFHVAFSNNGKYLACVLAEEYDYPILVYKVRCDNIDEGKIHVRFSGHKNFVYSLSWSHDDRYLLSVSSDQTTRFWDVRERIIEYVQSLPHPSYVYCGKFFPEAPHYIVTGCYDHVARIWARLGRSRQYELVQELEAHESFVNAVCIQPKVETCLTGDGIGVIVVWLARKSRRSPIKREWTIARKIKIRELEGVPINTILMHPMGSRMIVHSRNNGLRLLDLASGVVVRKFEGLKNHRIQATACISPCGSLLFCGNEDSTLNAWNVDNGNILATYKVDSVEKAVTCVDYHPYDHVLAYAIFGSPVPVKILKYDREADGSSVGLKLHNVTSSAISVSSTIRMKDPQQPPIVRNGVRHLEVPFGRGLNSSSNISQVGSIANLLNDYKDDSESRRYAKGKLQKFIVESGPNLKTKSMNRLNGIIEKIDRILMYATSQKSPGVDLESGQDPSIFTIEKPSRKLETFELQELPPAEKPKKTRKQRHRSRSARNACSPTPKEIENSKAFSDSAAFIRKVSRFSDDSARSNSLVHEKFVVEKTELNKLDYADTESGFKDSLDTIIDGKEDFPSEENLDVESLKSDDTYVVEKKDGSSDRSNATFVIENEVSIPKLDKSNTTFIIENEFPVPKPRRRSGRIEVM